MNQFVTFEAVIANNNVALRLDCWVQHENLLEVNQGLLSFKA
jgi:hypothetical protein